ncbi:MAG: ferrous iron transport protein A [Clostridia bacterium]|nr:ferrous iron transport protein A [Clostridia bacterium]
MKDLCLLKDQSICRIAQIQGDKKFINKAASMGLVNNIQLKVLQNSGKLPLILYASDTMIALNRKEACNILVEEVS